MVAAQKFIGPGSMRRDMYEPTLPPVQAACPSQPCLLQPLPDHGLVIAGSYRCKEHGAIVTARDRPADAGEDSKTANTFEPMPRRPCLSPLLLEAGASFSIRGTVDRQELRRQ